MSRRAVPDSSDDDDDDERDAAPTDDQVPGFAGGGKRAYPFQISHACANASHCNLSPTILTDGQVPGFARRPPPPPDRQNHPHALMECTSIQLHKTFQATRRLKLSVSAVGPVLDFVFGGTAEP
jgi:hypothetical protein